MTLNLLHCKSGGVLRNIASVILSGTWYPIPCVCVCVFFFFLFIYFSLSLFFTDPVLLSPSLNTCKDAHWRFFIHLSRLRGINIWKLYPYIFLSLHTISLTRILTDCSLLPLSQAHRHAFTTTPLSSLVSSSLSSLPRYFVVGTLSPRLSEPASQRVASLHPSRGEVNVSNYFDMMHTL